MKYLYIYSDGRVAGFMTPEEADQKQRQLNEEGATDSMDRPLTLLQSKK